jgi:hypothetical protein
MKIMIYLLVLVAAATGRAAPAAAPTTPQCQSSGASVEYLVEGAGGGYEVNVSPGYVTVFHLPEPITNAFLSDKKNFSANVFTTTVLVYPQHEGLTANLNIDTKSLHISVILKSGPVAQAKAQVIFSSLEPQKKIEDEIERRLAPLRADLDAKLKERTRDEIAYGLLRQFAAREASAINRNDDNVIARVTRAIRVGDDWYLYFTIENRGGAPYRVLAAKASQPGHEAVGKLVFESKPEGDKLGGTVPGGAETAGVIILSHPTLLAGQPVSVQLVDDHGQGLALKGILLD